jgi:hypothetical protein
MDSHTVIDAPTPVSVRDERLEERIESGPRPTRVRRAGSLRESARATGLGLADLAAEEVRPKVVRYTFAALAVGFIVGRILR